MKQTTTSEFKYWLRIHGSAAALLYTEWHTISKAAHILEGLSYFKVFTKGRLQLLLINTIVLKSLCFEFPYNRERTKLDTVGF